MTVYLNVRLLLKLLKRGMLGGSSKNHYLKDNVRKIDMQLIFPKKHWKLNDHEEYFSVDLQDYTFVGGQLRSEILTIEEKVTAQTANCKKAKERLKEAKSTLKKASSFYKSAAKIALEQAERNEKNQSILLKEFERKLTIKNEAKKIKKQVKKKKEVDENGQL